MEEQHRKALEELASQIDCPKNFSCIESGFENLGKAKDCGLEDYLDCLNDSAASCKFAVHFGYGHFCRCPVRVYIGKKLGI